MVFFPLRPNSSFLPQLVRIHVPFAEVLALGMDQIFHRLSDMDVECIARYATWYELCVCVLHCALVTDGMPLGEVWFRVDLQRRAYNLV